MGYAQGVLLPNGSPTNNPFLDALIWGVKWEKSADYAGPVKLAYSFVPLGYEDAYYFGGGARLFSENARMQLHKAMKEWENVVNIKFVKVDKFSQADIAYWVISNEQMIAAEGTAGAGFHEIPGLSEYVEPLFGMFNGDLYWSKQYMNKGGKIFENMIHELGHGLGLAHTFDGGTLADKTLFPGVNSVYGPGDHELNSKFTSIMSYNNFYVSDENATAINFGRVGTPMAFDIAAIQFLYGSNTNYHKGNNSYALPDRNAPGAVWQCIWDVGGQDTISNYGGKKPCSINLMPATLLNEDNGGGWYSCVAGVEGGYSIANNVLIENAIGGKANDELVGNNYSNTLKGGAGDDKIYGSSGEDILYGQSGSDTFLFSLNDTTGIGKFDTIADYKKSKNGNSDKIYIDNAVFSVGGASGQPAANEASINPDTGVATFAVGSGNKIQDALVDISQSMAYGGEIAGEFAFFKINNSGSYYLFISDGIEGVSENDVTVKLSGVRNISQISVSNNELSILV